MTTKKSNIIGGYAAKDLQEDRRAFLLEEKGVDTGHFKKTIYVLPAKPAEVKEVRKKLAVTQQDFADIVGVSLQTIKAWETGLRHPDGPASKLMRILQKDPKFAARWARA
jgi:DNA-binding transcriptional regulator YiaG